MSYLSGFSAKSAGSAFTAARCRARSPTTFDDGVTFGTRPRMRLAAAYMSSMSSKSSARPSAIACWRRFESWPPGISWWYTRPVGPGQAGLERPVEAADGLPVRLEVGDRLQRDARVALGVRERRDERRGRRLAGGAGHRRARHVDGVDAGVGSPRAASRAARRRCRGCAGARAGRTARAARSRAAAAAAGRRRPGHVLDRRGCARPPRRSASASRR